MATPGWLWPSPGLLVTQACIFVLDCLKKEAVAGGIGTRRDGVRRRQWRGQIRCQHDTTLSCLLGVGRV